MFRMDACIINLLLTAAASVDPAGLAPNVGVGGAVARLKAAGVAAATAVTLAPPPKL